jgi:hypothetical protein
MQNVAEIPTYRLLREAQAEALNSRQYDSEGTRATIIKKFTKVFEGKGPYDWQVDTCEALLLGLDCIVIAVCFALNTFLRSFFLSEYQILTAVLVETKLLGFRLLWDVTVYVIDRGNCPTIAIFP